MSTFLRNSMHFLKNLLVPYHSNQIRLAEERHLPLVLGGLREIEKAVLSLINWMRMMESNALYIQQINHHVKNNSTQIWKPTKGYFCLWICWLKTKLFLRNKYGNTRKTRKEILPKEMRVNIFSKYNVLGEHSLSIGNIATDSTSQMSLAYFFDPFVYTSSTDNQISNIVYAF